MDHMPLSDIAGVEMTELSDRLHYSREVVRVWFCNKRQALKNTIKRLYVDKTAQPDEQPATKTWNNPLATSLSSPLNIAATSMNTSTRTAPVTALSLSTVPATASIFPTLTDRQGVPVLGNGHKPH